MGLSVLRAVDYGNVEMVRRCALLVGRSGRRRCGSGRGLEGECGV